jgi:IclR family KDG regulon transcriptional repressor
MASASSIGTIATEADDEVVAEAGEETTSTGARATTDTSGSVVALRRGLDILDAFSGTDVELGVNEIARQIGVHKSTVSRLCSTLESAGYLRRDGSTNQRFKLGQRVYQLAGMTTEGVDLRATARPVLDELVKACRETASLTIMQADEVVTIDVVDGLNYVRMHSQVGSRPQLHASAGAKVLLAWLSEADRKRLLKDHELAALTDNTITSLDAFEDHLAMVRARGYSDDLEELEIGLRCVGAPVRDNSGRVVAGISLSGPRHRMTSEVMDLLSRLLIQSAEAISSRLGAPPAPSSES